MKATSVWVDKYWINTEFQWMKSIKLNQIKDQERVPLHWKHTDLSLEKEVKIPLATSVPGEKIKLWMAQIQYLKWLWDKVLTWMFSK